MVLVSLPLRIQLLIFHISYISKGKMQKKNKKEDSVDETRGRVTLMSCLASKG